VIATRPSGAHGPQELWKLNHYHEPLDDRDAAHGNPKNPFAGPPAEAVDELHTLIADPEERHNRVEDTPRGPQLAAVDPRSSARREATPRGPRNPMA
jgi:hypothetical protein